MFFRIFLLFLLLFMPGLVAGQSTPDVAEQSAGGDAASNVTGPDEAETPDASSGKDWRDSAGYPFPALADTVAAAQNMAQAMILRDYCANKKLPDDFVRERLALFSRITGREEDCRGLGDYW